MATNATSDIDSTILPGVVVLATAQAIACVNIVVEIYILVALVSYGVREKILCAPWKRPTTRLLLIAISVPLIHLIRMAVTEYLLIVRLQNTMTVKLNLSYNTTVANQTCNTLINVSFSIYVLALLPSFVFMWYRHRTIYRNFNFSQLKMNVMSKVSYLYLTVILVFSIATISIEHNNSKYLQNASGCVLSPSFIIYDLISHIAGFLMYSISWTVIVGLLCYLLLTVESTQSQTDLLIRRVIKTSVFSLLLRVCSNIVATLLVLFVFPKSWPRYTTIVVIDCSLAVNSVSIVMSYLNCWEIFYGWLPTVTTMRRNNL